MMRRSGRIFSALLLLTLPAWGRAQFKPPSPDELKMTSDPKAPGASAVYLDREEDYDRATRDEIFYARMKILSEKGMELATVRIPYFREFQKVIKIEARTIHPDGTILPLTVKPESLLDFKSGYFQEDTFVFSFPAVEVGSVLEYRVEIQFMFGVPPPVWRIQNAYFTHKAHFSYELGTLNEISRDEHGKPLDRLMVAVTPPNAPIALQHNGGGFTADLTDIPPVPDDDWMPPLNTLRWRVEFYYTYAHTADEFWDTEAKFWAQDTENFIKVTGAIKKAAASMVAPGESDEQKARKIYAAVMKLDNTDFSRVKSKAERKKEKLKEIHSVEDVWRDQSASGSSIALLYVALARAAGLHAWALQVVDRNRAIFDRSYFNVEQLDDYLAIVDLGPKEVILDPGQRDCPFGTLQWAHTLAMGFRESAAGPKLVQTSSSSYRDNTLDRTADLTLDAHGNLKGMARFGLRGAEALYWRQLALENDEQEVEKQFDEWIRGDLPDGVTASFNHFLGLDNYEANLVAVVDIGGRMGFATGKRYFLPGLFFESRAKHPFVAQEKRTTPIDMQYPVLEQDDVTYHLPAGFAVASAPPAQNVVWKGFAVMHVESHNSPDGLDVRRGFGRNFTLLGPEAYTDLHDFYLKMATADQQQIVLTRPPAPQGK